MALGALQLPTNLRSIAGISKLWLTQWSHTVEYNYWSLSDDGFFNSVKLKGFVDSTLPSVWYSANVNTKAITFRQQINKTKQGFVFTDLLTLTIPSADNDKWKQLVDILNDRYILIFKDNNGEYWCSGYKYGAKAQGYKRANNEYILEFQAISDNKILTNISEDYVINSII